MAEHREILLLNKTESGIRYMFVLAYIEQIFDSLTSKFPTPHQITHLLKIFPPDIASIGTEEKKATSQNTRRSSCKGSVL
jgi:hypothetical protein